MKLGVGLLIFVVIIVLLWKYGFVEKFLGPWASWAKFIGYFQ
jgi:hypothetical protein